MGAAKTTVRETLSKDIQHRSETPSPTPADAGRAIGEEKHTEITPDRIRLRAYEIYEARNGNGEPGDALSDWVRAERELNGADRDATTDTPLEVKVREGGGSVPGAQKR